MAPNRSSRRVALLVMALVAVFLTVATKRLLLAPEQLRRRALAFLERYASGEIEVDRVTFHPARRAKITRLRLRPRGAAGAAPPGEIVLRNVILEHSPTSLLMGEYRLLHVSVDEMTVWIEDPTRFLETLRALLNVELIGSGPPAPISIGRVIVISRARPIPLTFTPGGGEGAVFEAVSVRPDRLQAALEEGPRYEFHALTRAGPHESIRLEGRADMGAAVLSLELHASNLDLGGRHMEGLSPDVARWFDELRPSGPLDLNVSVEVPWQHAGRTKVRGEAQCYDVVIAPRGFRHPLTNVSGRVRFDEGRIVLESMRGVYGTGEVRAQGTIAEGGAGTGVGLDFTSRNLDLSDLAGMPFPEEVADVLSRLALEGRALAHLRLASAPSESLARAHFEGDVSVRDGSAAAGRASRLFAQAWFAGDRGGRAAGERRNLVEGSVRIERVEAAGVPLRSAIARFAVDERGLEVSEGEGRVAGGEFRLAASLSRTDGGAELQAAARDIDLAELFSALYARPVAVPGRAAGTLTLRRGALGTDVRADLDLAPVAPERLPALVPLFRALEAAGVEPHRIAGGHITLARPPGRASAVTLVLEGADATIDVEVSLDADWNVSGAATAKGHRFAIGGSLEEPVVTPMR